MNKIFAFPLFIKGTEEELNVISTKLISLGYRWDVGEQKAYRNGCSLATNFTDISAYIGYGGNKKNRTVVDTSNEELVLALAAACSNDTFQKGEQIKSKHGDIWYTTWGLEGSSEKISDCRRPTKDEILEHFSKKEKDFVLPEKWYIEMDKEEDMPYFNEYWKRMKKSTLVFFLKGKMTNDYFYFSKVESIPDYTQISMDQFRQYVLKENISNRRIIGYKAPFNLFSGKIPQGTIYKAKNIGITTVYKCDECEDVLPKEIVEQWEPVYEKIITFKKINIETRDTEITIHKNGKIQFRGSYTYINTIQALYDDFVKMESRVIGDTWGSSVDKKVRFIRVGCETENNLFSLTDLWTVISTHKELQK